MKNYILPFLILTIVFAGCISNSTDKKTIIVNTDLIKFRHFIKKLKPLSLPLIIKTLDIDPVKQQKTTLADNKFLRSNYPDETLLYGLLPDTTLSYKVIWLDPAEIHIPVLTTFSKVGKKINQEYLGVNGCGSDCCFNCKEVITINKDMTIYSADSIRACECDSNGPKENTYKKYVRYQDGKIYNDGKINMSKIKEKYLNQSL